MTITTVNPADATPRADATVPSQRTESRPAGHHDDTRRRRRPRPGRRPEMSSEDLDAQSPAADLVRVYLNGIGKTALLTAEQEVDLARRIEAGVFAQHMLDAAAEEGRTLERQYAADLRAVVRDGHSRAQPPAGGQPPAGRVAGQALHRPRHAAAGPDPGGQPRADPRGREVRLHQGLQVLDLRHVVDPAGDHPRHGRPGPHDPAARAPGRAGQQAGPASSASCTSSWAATPPRRSWPRSPASPRRRSPTCSTTPATRCRWTCRSAPTRRRRWATSSRTASPPTPRPR